MIFEKEGTVLSLAEFEKLTQAKWQKGLTFEENVLEKIIKQSTKLEKRGEVPIRQLWFGKYFEKEILLGGSSDVAVRWINETIGWGVFALRNFQPMEFIAEYVGKLRKRGRSDHQNSYCFEYPITPEMDSSYTIDAMDQGSLSRYINHSDRPNLNSALATVDHVTRVILHTNRPVAKDEQLCYDYGPDYWSKRSKPLDL